MNKPEMFREKLELPIHRWNIQYRTHATRRMFHRKIRENDILQCLEKGVIIAEYPGDFPFPSYLINGRIFQKSPLHVVASINREENYLYYYRLYS
jgi:hypothetical protein